MRHSLLYPCISWVIHNVLFEQCLFVFVLEVLALSRAEYAIPGFFKNEFYYHTIILTTMKVLALLATCSYQ